MAKQENNKNNSSSFDAKSFDPKDDEICQNSQDSEDLDSLKTNQISIDESDDNELNLKNQGNAVSEDKTLKNVILILSFLVVGLEIVLSILGIEIEIKLIVESLSALLAILVSFGVLRTKQKKTYNELKTEIEEELMQNKDNISSKVEKIKNKISKTQKK